MISINRKIIEEYYNKEWQELISTESIKLLVELTCKSFNLNQSPKFSFYTLQEPPKIQALGQI